MQSEPFRSMTPHEQQQTLLRRWEQLEAARQPMLPIWQEAGHYLMPHSGRFAGKLTPGTSGPRGRTAKREDKHIFDNTGSIAIRQTAAGLMAYASSPSRQWHRLGIRQPEIAKRHDVAGWLDTATDLQREAFRRAEIYRNIHQTYVQTLVYGTACGVMLPHRAKVMQLHMVPIGSFCLDIDEDWEVDTMYREIDMPLRQVVAEFGLEQCSKRVQQAWRERRFDQSVGVIHAIEPRPLQDLEVGSPRATSMPWRSVYFERDAEAKGLLRESGFRSFPVVAPRWEVEPGEVYCRSCPGIAALGDIKGLQHAYRRLSQAIDYKVRPPVELPTSLQNKDVDLLPGGKNFSDQQSQAGKSRAMWEVNLQVADLAELMEGMRERIRETTLANLFYLINSLNDTTQRTKAEIDERNSERLHLLGPAQENLQDELLRVIVELGFEYMVAAGAVPPPPPDLVGVEWNVDFISSLAQAQRSADIYGMERLIGLTGTLATIDPAATDKLDVDRILDAYGERMGVPVDVLKATEDVQKLRQARQAALAAKEQVEALQGVGAATNDLANSPSGEGTALADLQSSVFSAL